MKTKIVLGVMILCVLTVAVMFTRYNHYSHVIKAQSEVLQNQVNTAITGLFIGTKQIHPSINMYYRYAGNSALFLNARHAKNQRNFKESGDFLTILLDRDNKGELADQVLREAYITLSLAGRIDEAAKYSDRTIAKGENDLLTIVMSLAQAIKAKNYQRAEEILNAPKEKGYNKNFIILLQAWVEAGKGNMEQALSILKKTEKEKSFQATYMLNRALLLDLAGDKEAGKLYKQMLGENGKDASIRTLQIAISYFRRMGDEDTARQLLEVYTKNPASFAFIGEDFFYPEDSKAPIGSVDQGIAEALLGVATNYTSGNDAVVGMMFLRVVDYLDPSLVPAKKLLAELLERNGMIDEAINLYDTLPENGQLYFISQLDKVNLLLVKGEYAKAQETVDKLDELYGRTKETLIARGDIYKAQENFIKAAEFYTQALETLSEEDSFAPSLYAARGMMLAESGDWENAEKDLLKSLSKRPTDSATLNYLGYSWLIQKKNLDSAQKMIALALEKSNNDPYIADSFGWSFYMLGDYDMAIKILEKSLEALPSNSVVNDHLGDAYWKAGRKREAIFQWLKAIRFNNEIKPKDLKDIEFKVENGLEALEAKLAEEQKKEKQKKQESKDVKN